MKRCDRQKRDLIIIEMRNRNIGMKEIAECLGTTEGIVQHVSSKNGVGGHRKKCDPETLKTSKPLPEEMIRERINGMDSSITYVDGYKDSDSIVSLKCHVCGSVFTRSMSAIRHSGVCCPVCIRAEKILAKERKRQEEETRKKIRRELKRIEREKRKEEEENAKRTRTKTCVICGNLFADTWSGNRLTCSTACSRKYRNIKPKRITSQNSVDAITLPALYKRDSGICHICGMLCNYNDFVIRNGAKICGDWYPSIDHVKPLSKGGLNSWENVRLAHRRCNYIKRDSLEWTDDEG